MKKEIRVGLILGFGFALIDALLMLPLAMPDKTLAIIGASINRFAIGFLIPLISFPKTSIQKGLFLGFLLSLPDAIITKSFLPVMVVGILGGLLCGIITDKLLKR